MPRTFAALLALATLSATAPILAQSAYSADPGNSGSSYTDPSIGSNYTQPPAPIERSFTNDNVYPQQGPPPQGGYNQQRPRNATSEPTHGVWLVSAPEASVQTVSATSGQTELRVEHGRVNVNIFHPADHSEILVDLPGGQVSLLKDGLYTFNAEANTVRVLRGEAEVSVTNAKPVKIKEDHQFVFGQAKATDADPNQLRADLLQGNYSEPGYRHGDGYGEGFYGYPYAYGPYGWPYYGFYGPGWGSPYAFGGPFGYGYPYGYGFGLGFGYYGGFRGGFGGFRGYGFRR